MEAWSGGSMRGAPSTSLLTGDYLLVEARDGQAYYVRFKRIFGSSGAGSTPGAIVRESSRIAHRRADRKSPLPRCGAR